MAISEDELQALRDGNKAVFRALFLEYQPRLYRFFWLKLRSVEVAEDLVQETFLRLWQARVSLRADSNLEVLLFRIAANLAIDFLRSYKKRRTHVSLNESMLMEPQTSQQFAEYEQLAHIIDQTVAGLSDQPRTAFVLSRYENLSHKEIAEVMGLSVKTVEKHIGKALRILRARLQRMQLLPH